MRMHVGTLATGVGSGQRMDQNGRAGEGMPRLDCMGQD